MPRRTTPLVLPHGGGRDHLCFWICCISASRRAASPGAVGANAGRHHPPRLHPAPQKLQALYLEEPERAKARSQRPVLHRAT